MTNRRHRLRRAAWSERGQALVEFALIVPLLLIIVAGIVGFGIGLNYYLDLTHTANQGARYAAVNLAPVCTGSGSTPCSGGTFNAFLTKELTSSNLQNGGTQSVPNGAVVTTCFIDENNDNIGNIGEPVKVAISARYRFLPFVKLDVNLVGRATMRMEQTPTKLAGQGGSLWVECT